MGLAVPGVEHTSPLVTAVRFSPVTGIAQLFRNLEKGSDRVSDELEQFVAQARSSKEVPRRELQPFTNGVYSLNIALFKEPGNMPQIEVRVTKSGSEFSPNELNTIGWFYLSLFGNRGRITSVADGYFQLVNNIPTATIEIPTDVDIGRPRLDVLNTLEYHV